LSWQEVEASIAIDHSAGRALDVAIHSIKDTIRSKKIASFGDGNADHRQIRRQEENLIRRRRIRSRRWADQIIELVAISNLASTGLRSNRARLFWRRHFWRLQCD
jgi:hypothetical protein